MMSCILPDSLRWVAGFLLALNAPSEVDGYAYMMAPISRTFWYTSVFQESGFPDMEHCPHCYRARDPFRVRTQAEASTEPEELALFGGGQWPHLAAYEMGKLASNGNYYETDGIAVRHRICGDPAEEMAAEGTDLYGKENSVYPVLDAFSEGGVIEMKVVMSTYRGGHIEAFICNAEELANGPDSVVTQGCFNIHPLNRAADDYEASPVDPNHPGRYFIGPPCVVAEMDQAWARDELPSELVTARYQLPDGLVCSRCILQMVYYTGDRCRHPGYDDFDPPAWPSSCAPNKHDWINGDLPMCGEGDAYPQESWNCADIEITPGRSSARSLHSTEQSTSAGLTSDTATEHDADIFGYLPPGEHNPPPEYNPALDHTPAPQYDQPGPAPTHEVGLPEFLPQHPTPSEMPMSDTKPPVVKSPTYFYYPRPTPTSTSSPNKPIETPTYYEYPSPSPKPSTPEVLKPLEAPTYEYYEPTPTPLAREPPQTFSDPLNPKLQTAAPANVASSVPGRECADEVAPFERCGGDGLEESRCCRMGDECVVLSDCYSECRPKENGCSERWGQCGGIQWDGPHCCWEGVECVERNEWYSQCVPETP